MTELLDSLEATVQARLRASAVPDPLQGPIPTLWDGDGILEALDASAELLTRARPRAVQLHTWDPEYAAKRLRELLPGVALIVGCGIDGVARRVALGEWSVARGRDELRVLAWRAADAGALAVCWNAEASWKRPPRSDEAARLDAVIRSTLALVAQAYPALRQWHTSYDHPSYHSSYPWKAWLGPGSPVEVSLPQVYAAPGEGLCAHRGALEAREARALASWGAAVRAGWIAPDDPGTAEREGVRWAPYYQLHSVLCADTVESAVRHPLACLWALRSRSDEAGRTALLALCELWRRGFWGEGAVQRFQASVGLRVDGDCGPLTRQALGIA